MTPHLLLWDPLVEDLCLLSEGDLSHDPLGEDLSLALPLAPASVPEAVPVGVVVVPVWVVVAAALDSTPAAGRGS